jgi:hypothetical protein
MATLRRNSESFSFPEQLKGDMLPTNEDILKALAFERQHGIHNGLTKQSAKNEALSKVIRCSKTGVDLQSLSPFI